MATEYEKEWARYLQLKKDVPTNPQAKADKAKSMNAIRAMEREAARAGTILIPVERGDKVDVETEQTESKRSMQEEYVRKFDGEVTAQLPDPLKGGDPKKREKKEQTLREYHRKRLLRK